MAFKFCVFFDFVFIILFIASWFFMDLSWIFHDFFWIVQRFFMKFHGSLMDFSSKFWSTGASYYSSTVPPVKVSNISSLLSHTWRASDESNITYEVTIVPPLWSQSFAKPGNFGFWMFGHMICSHEKYHHDVNVQQFLNLFFVWFLWFFMFFSCFSCFFFQKNESAGASLVQVCCKLAPLVCNFDC